MRIDILIILPRAWRLYGEELQPLAIHQHFQIAGFVQPFDKLIAIARQANLYFIFPIAREGVVNQRAAARSDGEALDVIVLRDVGLNANGVAAWRALGAPYRQAADLLR